MRIIQFLNWDINSIISCLDKVKEQNFDTIQINPVQPFINVEGYQWWATYQPLCFEIGNIYGNKEDLKKLCYEAKKRGINVVVDVITNHLANDGLAKETVPNKNIKPEIKNKNDYWKKHSKVYDFRSYEDIIEESIGLPGLNLKNEELQNIILNFLNELKECGVKGFRFDAAKHIGLPSDNVSYFKKVKEFLDKNNLFAYAEFLDGPNDISYELTKTIYDKKNEFTDLMYILTEEHSLVKNPSKKVTFVESHDTYLNKNGYTRNKNTDEIIDEYVDLTKKYENTLYYVRDLTYGEKIYNNNPDRARFSDISWMESEKLKKANLNGKIKSTIEKNYYEVNENLGSHHKECMKEHERIINQIKENTSINDCINLVLTDYDNQIKINQKYGIISNSLYDAFLMDCVMNEVFKAKYYYPVLKNIGYEKFYIKTLEVLKSRIIGLKENTINQINSKIKVLSM